MTHLQDTALIDLLRALDDVGYRFVCTTPETHRRVVARAAKWRAADLRDIFGWSLPFDDRALLPPALLETLCAADVLVEVEGGWKSRVRVASLDGRLFVHSSYPTDDRDAVFFGPDTYRFVRFIRQELSQLGRAQRLVEIGAGSGAGAIVVAGMLPEVRVTLTDINPLALGYARINARHAGLEVETLRTTGLGAVEGAVDLVIANPPYMIDAGDRAYRHGGDMHGAALSLEWALAAARRLERGGAMLLYTGSAIVGGRDALHEALQRELRGCTLRYAELDPDIFGEQLDEPGYEDVERIAAVGAVIRRA